LDRFDQTSTENAHSELDNRDCVVAMEGNSTIRSDLAPAAGTLSDDQPGATSMTPQSINVTINGTGFAADYTARTYGMIPHKNGVSIRLAGVTSGRMENAEKFAAQHQIERAYRC
jgi:hypothetical protein